MLTAVNDLYDKLPNYSTILIVVALVWVIGCDEPKGRTPFVMKSGTQSAVDGTNSISGSSKFGCNYDVSKLTPMGLYEDKLVFFDSDGRMLWYALDGKRVFASPKEEVSSGRVIVDKEILHYLSEGGEFTSRSRNGKVRKRIQLGQFKQPVDVLSIYLTPKGDWLLAFNIGNEGSIVRLANDDTFVSWVKTTDRIVQFDCDDDGDRIAYITAGKGFTLFVATRDNSVEVMAGNDLPIAIGLGIKGVVVADRSKVQFFDNETFQPLASHENVISTGALSHDNSVFCAVTNKGVTLLYSTDGSEVDQTSLHTNILYPLFPSQESEFVTVCDEGLCKISSATGISRILEFDDTTTVIYYLRDLINDSVVYYESNLKSQCELFVVE